MKLTSALLVDLINFVSAMPQIKQILQLRDTDPSTFGNQVLCRFLKQDATNKFIVYYQVVFVFITKAAMEGNDDVSIIVAADHNNTTPSFKIHNVQYS